MDFSKKIKNLKLNGRKSLWKYLLGLSAIIALGSFIYRVEQKKHITQMLKTPKVETIFALNLMVAGKYIPSLALKKEASHVYSIIKVKAVLDNIGVAVLLSPYFYGSSGEARRNMVKASKEGFFQPQEPVLISYDELKLIDKESGFVGVAFNPPQ